MQRTVISLEEDDKEWLDRRAEKEGVPMTELVRRAVSLLRERMEGEDPPLEDVLEETAGIWPGDEGLEYQREIRDDW